MTKKSRDPVSFLQKLKTNQILHSRNLHGITGKTKKIECFNTKRPFLLRENH